MKTPYSLGPLEQRVMTCLWEGEGKRVSDVYKCLKAERKIAYTTVMTVMTRLVAKGYLSRTKDGKAHVYIPIITKKQTIKSFVRQATLSLVDRFGEEAIAAFADEVDKLSPKKRHKIISLLKKVK